MLESPNAPWNDNSDLRQNSLPILGHTTGDQIISYINISEALGQVSIYSLSV